MSGSTLEDRVLVRELYGDYAVAAAMHDGKAWLDCWAETATWKTSHFEASGRAAIEQYWSANWETFSNVAAFNEVGSIEISGDRAQATAIVIEVIALKAGGVLRIAGLYSDQLVRAEGKWRFACRDYTLLSREMSAA